LNTTVLKSTDYDTYSNQREMNMKLTAKQIETMDSIHEARRAVEATTKIALCFAANREETLLKDESEWWAEMSKIYGFDLRETDWTLKRVNGEVTIVEAEPT